MSGRLAFAPDASSIVAAVRWLFIAAMQAAITVRIELVEIDSGRQDFAQAHRVTIFGGIK